MLEKFGEHFTQAALQPGIYIRDCNPKALQKIHNHSVRKGTDLDSGECHAES